MKNPTQKQRAASALVVVMSVMATLGITVAVSMEYTATVRRNVQRSDALQSAISIADASMEKSFCYWRELCRSSTDAALGTEAFTSIPLPVQAEFPNVPNFSASTATPTPGSQPSVVSNFKVVAVDPQMNVLAPGVPAAPEMGQGKAHIIYNYVAQADVSLPVLTGRVGAQVRRVFQKEQLSPWNWAIFYLDPLEIQPGTLMNITGWVHTNSNLYTGHSDLHFQSKVTYGSDWVIGFRPGDERAPNGAHPEAPTAPSYPSNLPPAYDVAQQPFGLDSTRIFSTKDANPNNDSYHELIEPPVASGSPDPLGGKRYYDQAGVKVLIDSGNGITVKDQANNTITSGPLYSVITSAITTNQTIQDNREAAPVRLATLDMGVINTKIRDGTLTGFNGVIYIADTSAGANGGTPKRGIRLKNGATMPDGGLTVASLNPVYIQGDYNTGGSPPSNAGDPAKPEVSGYSRQPCAVICDALNILSNSWNDSNASSDLNQRIASNTTINAAIVAGIVPSANNNYSGGAENFPRFLEEWGNKTFTYYGSMVELFQSRQGIGTWGSDKVYGAPKRQWNFDSNLLVNVPPGSLPVFSYIKGRWFLADK